MHWQGKKQTTPKERHPSPRWRLFFYWWIEVMPLIRILFFYLGFEEDCLLGFSSLFFLAFLLFSSFFSRVPYYILINKWGRWTSKIHFFKVTGDAWKKYSVGSNDCLSGEKRQNNPLKSPSRAGSNGDRAGGVTLWRKTLDAMTEKWSTSRNYS